MICPEYLCDSVPLVGVCVAAWLVVKRLLPFAAGVIESDDFMEPFQDLPEIVYARPLVQPGDKVCGWEFCAPATVLCCWQTKAVLRLIACTALGDSGAETPEVAAASQTACVAADEFVHGTNAALLGRCYTIAGNHAAAATCAVNSPAWLRTNTHYVLTVCTM